MKTFMTALSIICMILPSLFSVIIAGSIMSETAPAIQIKFILLSLFSFFLSLIFFKISKTTLFSFLELVILLPGQLFVSSFISARYFRNGDPSFMIFFAFLTFFIVRKLKKNRKTAKDEKVN